MQKNVKQRMQKNVKLISGVVFILASLPAFFYFGFYIFTASSVDRTIQRNRQIEGAFREAATYIDNFSFENKRMPTEEEFYHRNPHHPLGESITLNGCAEPLPEIYGTKPENSYYLGYWRGEWCEFLTGWEQKTTLTFEKNNYFPLHSVMLTWFCFFLSVITMIGGVSLAFKNRNGRG